MGLPSYVDLVLRSTIVGTVRKSVGLGMGPNNNTLSSSFLIDRCQECINGTQGSRGFGSALLRCELAWDGARGFGNGKGCSEMA